MARACAPDDQEKSKLGEAEPENVYWVGSVGEETGRDSGAFTCVAHLPPPNDSARGRFITTSLRCRH